MTTDRQGEGVSGTAGDEPAPPIAAHGSDLSQGTTHGVQPDESERQGPAPGEAPYDPSDPGAPAMSGIGGAVEGDPVQHETDPAVPPGRLPGLPADDGEEGGG
jgi:hypothetical protein